MEESGQNLNPTVYEKADDAPAEVVLPEEDGCRDPFTAAEVFDLVLVVRAAGENEWADLEFRLSYAGLERGSRAAREGVPQVAHALVADRVVLEHEVAQRLGVGDGHQQLEVVLAGHVQRLQHAEQRLLALHHRQPRGCRRTELVPRRL